MTNNDKAITTILTILAVLGLLAFVGTVRADDTGINLARCLRAETDTYSGDWAGMAWVLRKRAYQKGVTLNEMVLDYCSVFDRRSRAYYGSRSEKIRTSTFDVPLHGREREWKLLERFVRRFLGGVVTDPCPEAEHFGNAGDVGRKALVEVCLELGKRGNKFYKVKR